MLPCSFLTLAFSFWVNTSPFGIAQDLLVSILYVNTFNLPSFVNEVSHWTMSDMNFTRFRELGGSSNLGPSCRVWALVLNCGRAGPALPSSALEGDSSLHVLSLTSWMASLPLLDGVLPTSRHFGHWMLRDITRKECSSAVQGCGLKG